MADPKRPPLPAILLANDLLDGDVIFASRDGEDLVWSRAPNDAMVATDDDGAARLELFAKEELAGNRVVDAYLVDVVVEAGRPVPRHFRERFKTLGPSHRSDLGKQAGDGITGTF